MVTGYFFVHSSEGQLRPVAWGALSFEGKNMSFLSKKYQFLDKIFLRVLRNHPDRMPNIFYKMFKSSPNTVIKFLSNKSNIFEDISVISKMPKLKNEKNKV